MNLINQYQNNKNSSKFLDPPYLLSCNNFYKDSKIKVYEYLYAKIINDMKALILLSLESNYIIKRLFKTQITSEYSKFYKCSKKKTTHLII